MPSLILAIAAGGAIGAVARHALNALVHRRLPLLFPYGILVVNVVGCLAIGLLAGAVASGRVSLSQPVRSFLFVGVLGGFTTFSSFGLDTLTLARGGASAAAFANVIGHVSLGLAAVWLGFAIGEGR